ncbi:platelet endothelial aggregation receptor 1, partial [Trichonephila clavipes]
MTSCNHMCCYSYNGSLEPFFDKTMLDFTRQGCHKTIAALLLPFSCPAGSTDLSPIEHICDDLRRRVGHPMSLIELEARCNEVCAKGTWGLYCKETCTCKNEATCLPDTGQCLCTPGWKGGNCELPCSSDYYGQECKQKCECENGAACNPVDGSCTCTPGYKGKKCNEVCAKGTWGLYCKETCTCKNEATCLPDTGQCLCTPGWKGGNCELPCSSDYYGQECKQKCECENGAAC